MNERIFIKPAREGINVRKLKGGILEREGEYVLKDIYYLKRIKDGDAVQVTDEAEIKKVLAKRKADIKKAAEEHKSNEKEA